MHTPDHVVDAAKIDENMDSGHCAQINSKVDSAFHPSKVDKMSTRNFWELCGKK